MESFKIRHHLSINLKELLHGPLLIQNSTNNNKYQNLMVISEDESPGVYVVNRANEN